MRIVSACILGAVLLLVAAGCEKKNDDGAEKGKPSGKKVAPAASAAPAAKPTQPEPAAKPAEAEKPAEEKKVEEKSVETKRESAKSVEAEPAKAVATARPAEVKAAPPGGTVATVSSAPPPRPGDIPAPPDVAASPEDAEKTDSGLSSKVLKAGTGADKPGPTDSVKVHYTGWTTDGKMFDSSVKRGEPISFPLNRVIAGWTEGVGLMVEGESRRLWIPQDLAYKGRPGAPAGMLVFDVELLAILP